MLPGKDWREMIRLGVREELVKSPLLGYSNTKLFPEFMQAAKEVNETVFEGDRISVVQEDGIKDYIFSCIGDWQYVFTECGEYFIDPTNIIRVNGEERLFGFRKMYVEYFEREWGEYFEEDK